MGKLAKIIISGPLDANSALTMAGITQMDPQHDSSYSAPVVCILETLFLSQKWAQRARLGKLAKIIISGPLEAHRALILVGITLIDPQHDSTMSHNVGYT